MSAKVDSSPVPTFEVDGYVPYDDKGNLVKAVSGETVDLADLTVQPLLDINGHQIGRLEYIPDRPPLASWRKNDPFVATLRVEPRRWCGTWLYLLDEVGHRFSMHVVDFAFSAVTYGVEKSDSGMTITGRWIVRSQRGVYCLEADPE